MPPKIATPSRHTECALASDAGPLMNLPWERFEDGPEGWRQFGNGTDACDLYAAQLIASYRRAHWSELPVRAVHFMYWHEGQLRAQAGQTDEAVNLLLSGVGPGSTGGFDDYALATVAFLRNDWSALRSARKRLAKQGDPASAINLGVVDGLIACFGKSYRIAYTDCRPTATASARRSAKP